MMISLQPIAAPSRPSLRRKRSSSSSLPSIPEDQCWSPRTQRAIVGGVFELINNARLDERRRRKYNDDNDDDIPLQPLQRSTTLDILAKEHVRAMAQCGQVFHSVSSVHELQTKLGSPTAGENIHSGVSLPEIYNSILSGQDKTCLDNIMSEQYSEIGFAFCKNPRTGTIYVCHLFR